MHNVKRVAVFFEVLRVCSLLLANLEGLGTNFSTKRVTLSLSLSF